MVIHRFDLIMNDVPRFVDFCKSIKCFEEPLGHQHKEPWKKAVQKELPKHAVAKFNKLKRKYHKYVCALHGKKIRTLPNNAAF